MKRKRVIYGLIALLILGFGISGFVYWRSRPSRPNVPIAIFGSQQTLDALLNASDVTAERLHDRRSPTQSPWKLERYDRGASVLLTAEQTRTMRPTPPATEEEFSSLSESLHESSTEFDLPDFPAFLRRIVPHITRGFGEREVSRLASLAERLPLNRENQTEFQVVFHDTPTPLRVRLFRDDVSSIGVYFFTSRPLADLLDNEMESFFAERGM